jgi:asparagine synthase (glutamine-hydrolysing)
MTSMIWGRAGATRSPEDAARALERMNGHAQSSSDALRCVLESGALAASGRRVHIHRDGDDAVVLAGRPRSNASLAGETLEGIARHVLEGYRANGSDVLRTLEGSFTVAILADSGREAMLAIDRMGVGTLSYEVRDDTLCFASNGDFLTPEGAGSQIDLQSLFNYFYHHMVPGPSTIRRDRRRLPPGGYLVYRRGTLHVDSYWTPRYDETRGYDLPALKSEFRALLRESVTQVVDGQSAGTFLSGGTDSSTLAGMLGEVTRKPARTYSIGFDAAGYDEMSYARIAAKHFATDHHEYYVTPDDVVALAPRIAAHCDQPFGNASSVPTYYCAMLARDSGTDLLLGGDGGDELFGGNERYATQAFFSWYSRVPLAVRRSVLEPLLFRVPGADAIELVRKGRSYVRYASMPMPDRIYAYNLLELRSAHAMLTPQFIARIDVETPLQLLRDAYLNASASGQLNRMLALDLRFTLADNDLYKVSSMCGLAGVDVAYPMLNDALVAFSTRLPETLKLKGTKLRYFFKEALRDFLPVEIINKRKHGFGLPIGVWMRSHPPLRDLAYDALDALVARGVVQRPFVAHLMEQHHADNAAYWGNEIWVLSQLELWLQAHGFARGQPLV